MKRAKTLSNPETVAITIIEVRNCLLRLNEFNLYVAISPFFVQFIMQNLHHFYSFPLLKYHLLVTYRFVIISFS